MENLICNMINIGRILINLFQFGIKTYLENLKFSYFYFFTVACLANIALVLNWFYNIGFILWYYSSNNVRSPAKNRY